MLAQLQDDVPRLSEIYRKMLRVAFFIVAPLMLGAAAIAKPLFELVLGQSWLPAVPFFRVLSIAALLYPIHAFNVNILQVFGRSDLFLKLEVIKKLFMVLGILIGFQFGIMGLVWSSVFTSSVSLIINTHYSSQLINYSTKNQLMDMFPILLLATITFVIMYFSVSLFDGYSTIIQLFSASFAGVVFYISIHLFLKTSPLHDLLTIIKNRKL
jgi:O-antigen/teichoic acid export membrane protein